MAIDPMDMDDDIRKELGELSPLLPPKQPDLPPDGYFDSFPDQVIQQWKSNEERVYQRKVLIRRWTAIAAISLGVMIGGWWFLSKSNIPSPTPALTLSSAEAYQYVMENINDFEGLLEQHVQWPIEEKIMAPDSSAVEEYLLEELQGHDVEQIF
jgi:hypothetical protein